MRFFLLEYNERNESFTRSGAKQIAYPEKGSGILLIYSHYILNNSIYLDNVHIINLCSLQYFLTSPGYKRTTNTFMICNHFN